MNGDSKNPSENSLGDVSYFFSVFSNKYLFSTYCVPSAGNIAVTRVDTSTCPHGAGVLVRKMDKQVNKEVDTSTSRYRYVMQRQNQRSV